MTNCKSCAKCKWKGTLICESVKNMTDSEKEAFKVGFFAGFLSEGIIPKLKEMSEDDQQNRTSTK